MQAKANAATVVRSGNPSVGWMVEKYSEYGTPCCESRQYVNRVAEDELTSRAKAQAILPQVTHWDGKEPVTLHG